MSLGRLLAAGKSFAGGRDAASPYRVNKRVRLPKFVSPRNPFASGAESEPASAPAESPVEDCGTKSGDATAKRDVATTGKNDKQSSMGARAARWLGEWRQKLNPFPRLAKQPGPVKSALPRISTSPVQPELSLDQVKVVRNDLSDADLEIVPMRARVASVAAEPVKKVVVTGNVLDRLTTKLLGAERT